MANVTELQYLEICQKVLTHAHSLAALSAVASRHVPAGSLAAHMIGNAGKEALALCELAAGERHRVTMEGEQSVPDRFDLNALASLPMDGSELGKKGIGR